MLVEVRRGDSAAPVVSVGQVQAQAESLLSPPAFDFTTALLGVRHASVQKERCVDEIRFGNRDAGGFWHVVATFAGYEPTHSQELLDERIRSVACSRRNAAIWRLFAFARIGAQDIDIARLGDDSKSLHRNVVHRESCLTRSSVVTKADHWGTRFIDDRQFRTANLNQISL